MVKVVLALGDNISTDIIYPGRFMATVLPGETPAYAFADYIELNKQLRSGEIPPGSVIVAGKNFGCGSSREQAASCLKGYDLVIVAQHFARIFFQNSINLGLRMVICPGISAQAGDQLEISPTAVKNISTGKTFPVTPMPESRQAIINAGGLVPYTRQRIIKKSV